MVFNKKAEEIFQKAKNKKKVIPRYQDYCFANIPNTILSLFDIEEAGVSLPADALPRKKYKHIIVLIVDALGYFKFKKCQADFSFLTDQAIVTPLTALFPSTTAASLATLSTGVLPKEHGLFEWHLYLPQVEEIIKTLPFCLSDSYQADELIRQGYKAELLLQEETIYEKLEKKGVKVLSFCHESYYKSAYNSVSKKGSLSVPFFDLAELSVKLTKNIKQVHHQHNKSLITVYVDYLDTMSHRWGPNNQVGTAEIKQILFMLQETLRSLGKEDKKETLFLLTADHGQITIDPDKTIDLNKLSRLKDLLAVNSRGKTILGTGGRRDVFCHIKEGRIDEAIDYLKQELNDQAEIYRTEEILNKGWFGPGKASKRFRERLGDILILPRGNNTAWFVSEEKKFTLYGHHGGLSPREMFIPLIACDLENL